MAGKPKHLITLGYSKPNATYLTEVVFLHIQHTDCQVQTAGSKFCAFIRGHNRHSICKRVMSSSP